MSKNTVQHNKSLNHNDNINALNVSDAAQILGVSPSTLRNYEKDQRITSIRQNNGYRVFKIEDIQKLKEELRLEKIQRETTEKLLKKERLVKYNLQNKVVHQPTTLQAATEDVEKANVPNTKKSLNLAGKLPTALLVLLTLFTLIGFEFGINLQKTEVLSYAQGKSLRAKLLSEPDSLAADVLGYNVKIGQYDMVFHLVSDFLQNVTIRQDLTVEQDTAIAGLLDVSGLSTLTGGIQTTDITFTGTATINGLSQVDEVTETTLENTLDVAGDVVSVDENGLTEVRLAEELSYDGTLEITGTINIDGTFEIGGSEVSATADELNTLSGITTTSGGVYFADGSTFAQDTVNFFWNDSNDRLGLGTNSPTSTLDVAGTITTTGLIMTTGASNGYILTSDASGNASWQSAGSTGPWQTNSNVANLITSTDNVTIGSSTNLGKLAIDGDSDEIQLLVQGNATQTTDLATFENSAGTDLFNFSNTGDLTIAGSLVLNSETVDDITGNGLTLSAGTLTIQTVTATNGLSATISNGSGLEVLSGGLSLLQGCANGEILKWNETNDSWECSTDSGATSAIINVESNDVAVGASVDTLDFTTDFSLTASPANEINIAIADDILDFAEFQDTLDLDTTTETNLGASNYIFDLDSTGDFIVQDGGTAFAQFLDDGTVRLGQTDYINVANTGDLTFVDANDGASITGPAGGNLTIDSGNGEVSLGTNDNLNLTATVDLIFGGTTSIGETTGATDSGAYLVGVFDEFTNSDGATVQEVLNDFDSAIGAGSSKWTDSGTLTYLTSTTDDLAIGGTDATAPFFFDESAELLALTNTTAGTSFIVNDAASDTTPFVIDASGNVGVGTSSPEGTLHAINSTFPVILAERTSSVTNTERSSFAVRHTTTGDMVDEFGSAITFQIEDSAAAINNIATIIGSRNGADNSGKLEFVTASAGTNSTKMTILANGDVGIGSQTPTARLNIDKNYTAITGTEEYALHINGGFSAADTGAAHKQALRSRAYTNATSGTANNLISVMGDIAALGNGGTTTDTYSFWAETYADTGATITNAYGLYVDDIDGAGTVGTQYGIYIDALTTASNSYAIYTEGATESYFGGAVGIGSLSPSHELDVTGEVIASGGFYVGTDSTNSLIDDASNGAGSTTLYIGNESILASGDIGSSVQAYDAELAAIAALATTDGNIIVGNGATWVAESGATARTSLGLGTGDSPTFTNLTLSGDLTVGTIGLNDVGTTNITSGASLVGIYDELDNSASTTVQDVIDDIDAAIGNRTYTADNYVTDGQSVTASIDALDQAISASAQNLWATFNADSGTTTANTTTDTLTVSGGTNGIDTAISGDTLTLNLDTTEIGDATFGSGSAITWTFDASAGTDANLVFGNGTITTNSAFTADTLLINDTNDSHQLALVFNENEATADRTLNLLVNGADRTLSLSGNLTVEAASLINQDVTSDAAVTFATLDTGQGANELYDMDQNVLTTSNPTFAGLVLTAGITANNAFDIDIDDATASVFTVSEGTNNYFDVTTSNGTEAIAFGNATTNPDYNFLGSSAVSIAGTFQLASGVTGVNEISTDDTLADASDTSLVTEQAIKAYVDAQIGGVGTSKWTDGGTTTYLTATTDDLAVGGSDSTSELFFDVSASALTLNPFGASAGNTGEMRFAELSANGSHYTGFKSPDSLAASVVYTLPTAAGSGDYVLTWQSGNTLEWKAVGGVSGAGDITDVGDIASGAAFTQTAGNDGNALYFEGSTADTNELQLTAADPGSDIAVTIPNIAGTLASLSGTQSFDGAKTFDATTTFNTDIDIALTGTENISITSAPASNVNLLSLSSTASTSLGTVYGVYVTQADSANANMVDAGVAITNQDSNLAMDSAILIEDINGGGFNYLLNTPSILIDGNGAVSGATGLSSSGTINFSSLTASRLLATDASSNVTATSLTSWVAGTANQITVGDDGDGSITLSLPQDIATSSTPTFAGLTLTGGITANNAFDLDIDDNLTNSFTITEGSNAYLDIDTNNTTEAISFGNATTNPDFNFLGSSAVSIAGTFQLATGVTGVNEISTDDTLADASDTSLVTEQAIKAYVDAQVGSSDQNLFETINAPAGTDPVADSVTDTLNLVAAGSVTITGDSTTDTITISATDNDTTYSAGNDLDLTGTTFSLETTLDFVTTINGLTSVDATTEDTIEALIFDADAENIAGVWEVQDNVAFRFGTDADFSLLYDETTDDNLELTSTNLGFTIALGNQDLVLTGSAEGTAAQTITAGDLVITNGDLSVASGEATIDSDATGQSAANVKALNTTATGSFTTAGGSLTNYAGYFSNTSTESAGANTLTNVGLYATASGADANYAAIFENGLVGIGTTTVDEILHVAEATNDGISTALLLENSNAHDATSSEGVDIRFGFGGDNDVARIVVQKQNSYASGALSDSSMAFYTDRDGTDTEAMRITSTGALGVNTTGPDAKIDSLSTTGEQLRLTYADGTSYTGFTTDTNGDLAIDASGGNVTLTSGDNLNLTAATDLIFGGTTSLGETTGATDSGAYLVGIFDEFDNSAAATVQGVINDIDTAIGNRTYTEDNYVTDNESLTASIDALDQQLALVAGSAAYWTQTTGVLHPTTGTDDLAIGGTDSTADFFVADNGKITSNASTTGTYLDFVLETEWTGGTLINADFASGTTQASDIVGALFNFNTNLTGAADSDVTGINVQTPALTSTGVATTNYDGYRISAAGALIQNTAAGTINWDGVDITTPNITQTTGTVTTDGISIANGTITTGGTTALFHGVATGVGAGTLYGLNIDGITGAGGTEQAINIGSGWDTDINSTTDLTLGIDGSNELTLTSAALYATAAEGSSLGSATNEWEALFLGDDAGITFGLNDDFTLLYDEATDDRLELTGTAFDINLSGAFSLDSDSTLTLGGTRFLLTSDAAAGATTNEGISLKSGADLGTNDEVLQIGDSAADFLTIRGDGNTGIGTSTPVIKLQVSGTSGNASSTDTPNGQFMINYTDVALTFGGGGSGTGGTGSFIQARNMIAAAFYALALNPNGGNVGVGTNSPDAALEINHTSGDSLRLTYGDADGTATNYTDFSLGTTGGLTLTGSASTLGASASAEKTFLTLTPGTITLTAPTQVTSLMETSVFTGATIAADAATTVDKATTASITAPVESTNVTLTDSSALRVLNTTGTPTNQYGLYIEDLTAGATADYGIYIAGSDTYAIYAAADDVAILDDLFVGATTETIEAAAFAVNGDDAFISGTLGVESTIYTDAGLDINNSTLTIDSSGVVTTTGNINANGGIDVDDAFVVANGGVLTTSQTANFDGTFDVDGAADFSAGLTNSAGELLVSGGNLQLNDSINLTFGTGDDLTIVHNGTNSLITSGTGDLVIDNTLVTGSTIFDLGTDTSATDLLVRNNSGVQLLSVNGAGTVQLGSNGQDGQLVIYNELGGTDYTNTFNPSASQGGDITYILPPDDGEDNYVLTTNGTGTMAWESVAGVGAVDETGTNAAGQISYFTDDNTITSSANWIFSDATTGTTLSLSNTALTTGELFDLTATTSPTDGSSNEVIDINITNSPSASANTIRGIDLTLTDGTALADTIYGTYVAVDNSANTSTGTHSSYAGYFSNAGKTAGATTAYGIYAAASGADNNFAGYFKGTASQAIRIENVTSTNLADIWVGNSSELVLSTQAGPGTGFLDIRTESAGTGVLIRTSDGSTTQYANLYMNDAATDYLNIVLNTSNATAGLIIQDGGNVGVGDTTPDAKFDVNGSGNFDLTAADGFVVDGASTDNTTTTGAVDIDVDTVTNSNIGLNIDHIIRDSAGITAYGARINQTIDTDASESSTGYGLYIAADNDDASSTVYGLYVDADADGGGTGTEYAAAFMDGAVGIGTATPDALLEVFGTSEQLRLTYADGTADARFRVDTNGDITLTSTGGGTAEQLILADTQVLNIGGSGSTDVAYNIIGDSASVTLADSDDDLYIEGTLEVDDAARFEGDTNFVLAASENFAVDNSTYTGNGVGLLQLTAATSAGNDGNNIGFAIDWTNTDDATVETQTALKVSVSNAAASANDSVYGIEVLHASGSDPTDAGLHISSLASGGFEDGILIDGTTGTITTAININSPAVVTTDINLQNGESIDNDTDNQITLGLGTAGTLLLTSSTSSTISNDAGDIILNSTDEITLGDTDTLIVGGHAGNVAYNVFSDAGGAPGSGSVASDNDIYVQGFVEIDGGLQVDATIIATDFSCTDCLDFAEFENTLDVDETTDINLGASNLTVDLDSTGIFDIRDGTTTFWSFDDDSTVDITFPAAGTLGIDAATTDNTTTEGVFDLNVDTVTNGNIGLNIDSIIRDSAGITAYGARINQTIDTDAGHSSTGYGLYIAADNDDATSTITGLYVDADADAGGEGTEYAAAFMGGFVGIGTATPGNRLHIVDTANTTDFLVDSTGNAAVPAAIIHTQYHGLTISTNENASTYIPFRVKNLAGGVAGAGTDILTLDATGSFGLGDSTPDAILDVNGAVNFDLLAASTFEIDAITADNTSTAGVINLDVDTVTSNNKGISIDYQVGDAAADITTYGVKNDITVDTDAGHSPTVYGNYIGLTVNDATSTTYGMAVVAEDAGAQVVNTGVLIENLQATDIDLTDALLVRATTNDSIVDAIDVSDAEITNAINIGDNVILGTTGTINFDNFDVASAGGITIASGQTLTIGTTGLAETTGATDSGAYLVGVFDEFDNSNGATVQAVLNDLDAALGGGAAWSITSNVIHPTTITDDLAIGGTDTTADFYVFDNGKVVSNASTTGTYLDFVLETEWTAGTLINADWASGTTQTAAMTGIALDFTNLTSDGTNALYGIHINDQVGATASTERAIYQQGTNWDYGLYVEDDALFNTGLDVNGNVSIADTDISLDGASTTFTQTTGAITLTPAAGSNLNVSLSGTGDLAVNTNDLYVDTSAGFVGIGLTSPASQLSVVGTTTATLTDVTQAASGNSIAITGTYGGSGGYMPGLIWTTSDNNATLPKAGIWAETTAGGSLLQFGTSNAFATGITNQAMVIDTDGEVGIGQTQNAKAQLQLNLAGGGTQLKISNDLSDVGDVSNIAFGNDSTTDWAKLGSVVEASGDMGLAFYTTTDSGATLPEKLRIAHDGDVGIGDTTPDAKLNILATTEQLRLDYDDSNYASFTTGATGNLTMDLTGTNPEFVFSDGINLNSYLDLDSNSATAFTLGDGTNTYFTFDGSTDDADTLFALTTASSGITSGTALSLNADTITSGTAVSFSLDGITSGTGVLVEHAPAGATTLSGDLFRINIGSNLTVSGSIFTIDNNGSPLFSVTEAAITSALPHAFTAAGDTSFAYDLVLTNQSASKIESYGPLTIEAGENFENNDLTLQTYGTGEVAVAGGGLALETGENLTLDNNDSGDSYLEHNNTSNYVSLFTDNTEVARFMSDGSVDGNTTFDINQFDIAETYPTKDATLTSGEIVSIDTNQNESESSVVKRAGIAERDKIVGIISTSPGFTMGGGSFTSDFCADVNTRGVETIVEEFKNSLLALENPVDEEGKPITKAEDTSNVIRPEMEHQIKAKEEAAIACTTEKRVLVALAGRVPVRISLENGAITAGDPITISSVEGIATKATTTGMIIGRALESYSEDDAKQNKDTIMVLIQSIWWNGPDTTLTATDTTGDIDLSTLNLAFDAATNTLSSLNNFNVNGDTTLADTVITGSLSAGFIEVNSLENSIGLIGASCFNANTNTLNEELCDSQTLYIQKGLAGNVDLFNGNIVMKANGDVEFKGTLIAEKAVLGEISVKETSDTIGTATIAANTTEITIDTAAINQTSKVFVTATSQTGGNTLFISDKIDNVSFTVEIENSTNQDITFDWFIINQE